MLADWHMVILRAKHQAQALEQALQALQAQTHLVPLIDIIPIILTDEEISLSRASLQSADIIIASSANAVFCAAQLLSALKLNAVVMTMGQATTQALQEKHGIEVHYTAPLGSTSESVLEEGFLQKVAIENKKIVILAGMDGRTVLADCLAQRGAMIQWMKVYRQIVPDISLNRMIQSLQQQRVCFVVSSSRMLDNLCLLTPMIYQGWLQEQPIIVVSQRIYLRAQALGFKQLVLAIGASIQAIVEACEKLTNR